MTHHAHGLGDGDADNGFAQPLNDAAHGRTEIIGFGGNGLVDPARQHQRPGRGIDETGLGLAEMTRPIALADLVGDQGVERFGIRRAQIGLGEAHQRDAFIGIQAVFGQQAFHHAGRMIAANGLDHVDGGRLRTGKRPGKIGQAGGKRADDRGLPGMGEIAYGIAQARKIWTGRRG